MQRVLHKIAPPFTSTSLIKSPYPMLYFASLSVSLPKHRFFSTIEPEMIPLKLELKNFLSYGDAMQTIDFQNHSLICLSGKNGNGKSALLDAITWAVWGQARKVGGTSKADEGLLRLGQTRMMVALTFMLNNKKYRVRREFSKTYGKPHAALDFEVLEEESGFFRSLTDKTIRATQEVIERTINLDFDTFINSAFLRQGQSNEFSKKTAKERKQILTNILGLATYDLLQQYANAEAKKLEQQAAMDRQLIDRLQTELEQEASLKAEQASLNSSLETVTKELTAAQHGLSQQERLLQQYEEQQKLKAFLESEQSAIQQRFTVAATNLHETREAWRELQQLLRNQPSPEQLEERRSVVLAQKKEQNALTEQLTLLEQQKMEALHRLQAAQFALEQEQSAAIQQATLKHESLLLIHQQKTIDLARLKQEFEELNKKQKEIAIILTSAKQQLGQEETFQKLFTTSKQQFEKRRAFYQHLVQLGNQGKAEVKEIEQKQHLLANEDEAACPLCSQALTPAAHAQVLADIAARQRFLNHRLNRIATMLPTLKQLLVNQHEAHTALEKQAIMFAQLHTSLTEKTQQQQEFQSTLENLTQELKKNEKTLFTLTEELTAAHTLLTTLQQQGIGLAHHPTLLALKQEIQKLEAIIAETKAKLSIFAGVDTLLTELEALQAAATHRSEFGHKAATLREKSWDLLKTLREFKKQHISYGKTLQGLQLPDSTHLMQALQQLQNQKATLEQRKATLILEVGRVTSKLERLAQCKIEAEQKTATLKVLQEEIDDFEQLGIAFGKNGIQALLIEEAIPEIEQEANELLAKLTDNQAQIFIESLRDLKSGGVKETLEIKVTDAAGIRPYEMFSGGEAFRVDFALRIAISKLLARRAGTALQTLIIDEGFGSQDDEGLGRIMNALYAIQSDFSKIIIVSHLNEFKDNFPVHFLVEKTSTGSVVHVEERG